MRRFKVELLKDFDFPLTPDFLGSPVGIFCRELRALGWLIADEGSIGHQLMADFVEFCPKDAVRTSFEEVDVDREWQEKIAEQELVENSLLQGELRKLTQVRIPRYSAFRTKDGKRQGLIGFQWVDIPSES